MATTRSRPRGRESARPPAGGIAAEHAAKIYGVAVGSVVVIVAFLALTGTGHVIDAATQRFMLYYAGVFALIALCASVALGLIATDRMFLQPGHRIFVQSAHRAASFGAVAFLLIHITTEILAQRVHVLDAVVPFLSPFRTFYIGLGTIASDLVLLLVITGILRKRFTAHGKAWRWRAIHYTSYVAFVFGVWHGLLGGRPGKPYVDWSYGFVVAIVALGLAVRMLANSLRPKENLSGPPVPESAHSGSAPMRAVSMFAQLSAARAATSTTVLAQSGPQPMLSAPTGGWSASPATAYAALPAAGGSYWSEPPENTDGRQPYYEPGYEGPPRYLGAPRGSGTGPIPGAASGPMPRVTTGHPSGPMPRADGGPVPGMSSGPMPRATTGPVPRAGGAALGRGPVQGSPSGPMPRVTTGHPSGPMPRADGGPVPGMSSGPMPRATTGPMPRAASGPMPRVPTGPVPRAAGGGQARGAGPVAGPASGPMPRSAGGPTPGPASGPMPRTSTGPMPRATTGPMPQGQPGAMRQGQPGPMPHGQTGPMTGTGWAAPGGGAGPLAPAGPTPGAGTGPMPRAGTTGRRNQQGGGRPGGRSARGQAPSAAPGWGTPGWAGTDVPADPAAQAAWAGYASAGYADNGYAGTGQAGWAAQDGWGGEAEGEGWNSSQPPWEVGALEPDSGLRHRKPGPGMPGYRGARDRFHPGEGLR